MDIVIKAEKEMPLADKNLYDILRQLCVASAVISVQQTMCIVCLFDLLLYTHDKQLTEVITRRSVIVTKLDLSRLPVSSTQWSFIHSQVTDFCERMKLTRE